MTAAEYRGIHMADIIDEWIADWGPHAGSGSGIHSVPLWLLIPLGIIVIPILIILALALIVLALCILLLLAGLVIWYGLPALGVDTSAIQTWADHLAASFIMIMTNIGA